MDYRHLDHYDVWTIATWTILDYKGNWTIAIWTTLTNGLTIFRLFIHLFRAANLHIYFFVESFLGLFKPLYKN